jgi:lipopolysaccharide export system protein LptC
MNNSRVLAYAALLGVLALVTQWLLWLERPPERGDTFVGPPRSDYVAIDYALVARDEKGAFAFAADGPRAVRHPFLGSFDLDEPRLRFRDNDGNIWHGRSHDGWVNKEGTVVKLAGEALLNREPRPNIDPITVASEHLTAHTDTKELMSDDPVTVTEPGSILRGTGMLAKLDQQHLDLMSAVSLHYDPKLVTPKSKNPSASKK